MVRIDIGYEGDLHCRAVHAPSGRVLETDAPVDNHGRGESFSPTDLLATGLVTCMATTMGIQAQKHGWDLGGMTLTVEKVMSKEPPRRVTRLEVVLTLPEARAILLDATARAELEKTAHNCPVRLSLANAVDVPVTFIWGTPDPIGA
ncbi:MAG TPA: OsmC family protein [Polyangiaceae bacterium]